MPQVLKTATNTTLCGGGKGYDGGHSCGKGYDVAMARVLSAVKHCHRQVSHWLMRTPMATDYLSVGAVQQWQMGVPSLEQTNCDKTRTCNGKKLKKGSF